MDVELSVQDEGVFFDNIWAYDGNTFAPDFDAYLWNWDGYVDPGQSLTCFTTGQIEGWNEFAWSNASTTGWTGCRPSRWILTCEPATSTRCRRSCTRTARPSPPSSRSTWRRTGSRRIGARLVALQRRQRWDVPRRIDAVAYSQLTPKVATEQATSDLGLWVAIIVAVIVVIAVAAAPDPQEPQGRPRDGGLTGSVSWSRLRLKGMAPRTDNRGAAGGRR